MQRLSKGEEREFWKILIKLLTQVSYVAPDIFWEISSTFALIKTG